MRLESAEVHTFCGLGGPPEEEVVTRLLGTWRLRNSFWERQVEEGARSPSPEKT